MAIDTAPTSSPIGPPETWKQYYLFEHFDGANGTYGLIADFRILAPDADAALRAMQQADVPIIT